MAYCSNCGQFVEDGVKFCSNCGSPVMTEDRSKRQQEFAGRIIKCPACGTEIPSFTAICPGCGHEINSAMVSSAFKDFTNQISQCDTTIANSPTEPKKGWASWSKGKRFGWVILNIYTLCIPLLIYLLLPLLGIGGMSSLTPAEQKKASVINNFAFPNDRESILEALLYIKGQTSSLASGKIDRNTARWMKIWKNKATQLYERAEMMFKGDKIATDAYSDILASEKKIKKSLLTRVVIATVLVVLFSVFVFSRSGVGKSVKESTATFVWPTSGIALQVPEPSTNRGEITFNDDENFWLEVRGIDQTQYEAYIAACQKKGFTIESEKDSVSYEAYNEEGYHLQLIHSSSSTDLTIRLEAPEPMEDIQWPKSDIAKRLPTPKSSYGSIYWEADYGFVIYLGNTSKQDFLDYADACYEAGFTVNYKKGDTYFRADDADGYHVNLEYRGNNIMFIRIDEPE
jgi:hypothetical protein